MQKKTITKFLALPNFEVVKVLEHHNESLHLYVDLIDPVEPVCSASEAVHNIPIHSTGWVRVED